MSAVDAEALGAFDGIDDAISAVDAAWIPTSAATIAREGVPPIDWDIEFFAVSEGPIVVFGLPESFKSWLAIYVARCMVTGEAFLGRFKVTPRPYAIVLNFDAGERATMRRIERASDHERLLVHSPEHWDAAKFEELLGRHPRAFVVIDCLADIFDPEPNQEPGAAMRKFLRGLRRVYDRYGCNGLILDHAKRPHDDARRPAVRYYGSVQKHATIRQMWGVERLVDEAGKPLDRIRLKCEKMSEAEKFEPITIEFDLSVKPFRASLFDAYAPSVDGMAAIPSAADRHRRELLERVDVPNGATQKQLEVDRTGGRVRRQVFKQLRDVERLIAPVSGSRPTRYIRAESTPESFEFPETQGHAEGHHQNGDVPAHVLGDVPPARDTNARRKKRSNGAGSRVSSDMMEVGTSSPPLEGPLGPRRGSGDLVSFPLKGTRSKDIIEKDAGFDV